MGWAVYVCHLLVTNGVKITYYRKIIFWISCLIVVSSIVQYVSGLSAKSFIKFPFTCMNIVQSLDRKWERTFLLLSRRVIRFFISVYVISLQVRQQGRVLQVLFEIATGNPKWFPFIYFPNYILKYAPALVKLQRSSKILSPCKRRAIHRRLEYISPKFCTKSCYPETGWNML